MKDLIAKLQLDANCALGAIWLHIDAQAARIAELEAQQAFGIGETYANALSRIAELEAQIAAASAPAVERKPAGYIRKWAFDGEKPEKRLNANNRMAWPGKFKFLPVTQAKILPDDIPLYAAPQAADTDKVREAMNKLHADIMNLPCTRTMSHFATTDDMKIYKQGHRDARHAAAELVASMAAQAPVREVPDLQPGVYAVIKLIQKQCSDYHSEHGSLDTGTGVWNYPGDGNEWMSDREELLDEIRALLPAAPVQEPKP